MRIIMGIIIGMLGVGLAQGIVQYYFTASVSGAFLNTGTKMIGAVTVGGFGAIVGAIIGFFASISNFPFPQSVILSLVLSFTASVVVLFIFGNLEQTPKQIILVFLIFGTIFGTIASLINKNTN